MNRIGNLRASSPKKEVHITGFSAELWTMWLEMPICLTQLKHHALQIGKMFHSQLFIYRRDIYKHQQDFDGGDYTVMTWVYPVAFNYWSRILDIGNYPLDDFVFRLSIETSGFVSQHFYENIYSERLFVFSNTSLVLKTWEAFEPLLLSIPSDDGLTMIFE